MEYHKIIFKVSKGVFLCLVLSFLSHNVYSQLTYITCNSSCGNTLVGHVTFANKTGTTTGRWTVDDLAYGGLTNESFTIRDPAAYTSTNGNLTSTGGGTYTIVSNPSTVNGPLGTPLVNKTTDGIFLIRPNDNANAFAVYKITGLQPQGKYCVRVKMRNAATYLDCNQSLYTTIKFKSLTGLDISGGGVSGGTWTRVENNPSCNQTTTGSWDGNNQTTGLMWDEYASWYECNFQLGQNPNNTNDDGFTLNFQADAWGANDVWGIDEIEVYGCITQQIASSNGTSVCQGTPTTLTAEGIGSTTDSYAWKQSADGGVSFTPIISTTSNTLNVTPAVTTVYSVTCARTSATVTTTITPVNCCGPSGLFTVPKVCESITVDGVDTEPVWYTAPWQTVNQSLALSGNQDCIVASPACAGVQSNPAGMWRCLYTSTDIYFDVRVNGANPQNAAGVYYQDAVEIYIANSANTPLQFGYEYVNGVPGFYNSNGAQNGSAKIVKNATYWDLEVRIPIAANNIDLTPGYLKMELGINQAKPGCANCRAAQLFTWIAANHYSSTSQYHTAPLSDCAGVKASAQTVCNGGSVILTTQLSTVNTGLNYTWQQSTDGGTTWTTIPGTTNTITVFPTVQTQYRAIYDNVNSCPVTISIGAITLATTNPAAVCLPGTVDLTAAAVTAGSQAGLTYTYFTDAAATTSLVNPAAVATNGTYYIKGQSASCFGIKSVTVTVNTPATPTFTQVAAICSGGTLNSLPTTSTNGVTGLWSPAIDNTTTTTYTFTPTAGQCANTTTMTITVNPVVTPTFTAVAGICSGGTLNALPTTSNNGITGTWSPALNNTTTTTYTFTPTAGQCASTATMIVAVNSGNVTPTFTQVAPICSGTTLSVLPVTSDNGITGTWSPAFNNTATTTYTFTPDPGQCASTTTMTITVNTPVTPTFAPVNPVCSGSTISALPTTSINGITGTWFPALNNTATTTYTFTPGPGQCATTTTLTITVSSSITPAFTQVNPVCLGSTISPLPTISTNGITGTWSPALNNTTTTTYTFTPDPGQCGVSATMTITVNSIPAAPTVNAVQPTCTSASGSITVTTPSSGVTYSFDNGNTFQASATSNNLLPATYQVVVQTIGGGCVSVATPETIAPQPAIPPTPTVSLVQTDCFTSTGTITVTSPASGVQYSFDNGAAFQGSTTSGNLVPGTYQVVVQNIVGGCLSALTSATIDPQPLTPSAPVINIAQPNCTTATGTITVTSPASGVQYSFDNGNDYQSSSISGSLLANSTYQVIVQGIVGGCLSPVTTATLNAQPLVPNAPNVISPVNYCQHDTTAKPLVATTDAGNTVAWYDATGAIGSVAPTPSTATGGSVTYYATSFNGTCESPKSPVTVTVDPISAYAGGPEVDVNQGQFVTLNGKATGDNITILWSPGIYLSSTDIEDPVVTPLKDTVYTMKVTSTDGCTASDKVQVIVLKDLIIPNAFSPNGDGINDRWEITYLDEYSSATVSIFNRYGQMIFQSSAGGYGNRPWDGTYNGSPVPVGTYYYIIKLSDGKKPLSGSISVIR